MARLMPAAGATPTPASTLASPTGTSGGDQQQQQQQQKVMAAALAAFSASGGGSGGSGASLLMQRRKSSLTFSEVENEIDNLAAYVFYYIYIHIL